MKILFVSQAPLNKELGASKVLIELADEMNRLGWESRLLSLMDLVPGPVRAGGEVYARALHKHLREHAGEYDVVDYDHVYLPYPRRDFPLNTLFVARSVLLAHHLVEGRGPPARSLKARLRALVSGKRKETQLLDIIGRAQATIVEADLVNVANHGDETTLGRRGISRDKIVVLPYGLSRDRRLLFDKVSETISEAPRIAFVGTFDSRKGAPDLPHIVSDIVAAIPDVSFSLLGTFRSEVDVLASFPSWLRRRIHVVPSYAPDSLPELLAPCSAGVFPSYMEGFGFGVLEMLAAGVPVIAYDVPGPPMMLPPEYLVSVGDRAAMSRKIIDLLKDGHLLETARTWARDRSRDFGWPNIAKKTSEIYSARWEQRRNMT